MPPMDGSLGGGFSGHGHARNRFGSSGPPQVPHFQRRGNNRRENRHPIGQSAGRGRDPYPITPQAPAVNQGQSFGPSFSPPPYTNPVNNTDGFYHGTPHRQGTLSNNSHPRDSPGNHHHPHTQSSPLINGYPAFDHTGSYNMEAFRAFPPNVTQAAQEGIGGSMAAAVGSIQPPALPPQAGSIDDFSTQRRHSLPCPVTGCPTSLSRTQDQRRHLLTHLPHWIHCPVPDCSWRGDRFNAFVRHWGNDHPSLGIQVPNEDQCRTYDPQPLMKAISEGTRIQDVQQYAISKVKQKAFVLQKPELFENPWGSKWKKQRNSDPHHLASTS